MANPNRASKGAHTKFATETLNPRATKGRTAMRTFFNIMAMALMALALVALPARVFAQAPPADTGSATPPPAAPPPATPPPAASGSASGSWSFATPPGPPPAAATTPMFPKTTLQAIDAKDLFVNMGVAFGTKWAAGVKEALVALVEDQGVRGDLNNLPEGATKQMAYLGGQPMNRAKFDAYLAAAQCVTTGEGTSRTASPQCAALAAQIAPLVDAAIKASKAEPAAKANARYLYEKCMGTVANPNEHLIGDQQIAMLHLAALMLPVKEWAQAYRLTDDTNALVGKSACFLRDGEKAKCGLITAADANGVTIGDETVTWDRLQGGDTVLAVGDTGMIERNWGKGGSNNNGFHLNAEYRYLHVYGANNTTNGTVWTVGAAAGYRYGIFDASVGAGLLKVENGGMASHQSQVVDNGKHKDGYVVVSIAATPELVSGLGLRMEALGMRTLDGGHFVGGGIGPQVRIVKGVEANLSFIAGHANTAFVPGRNPATPQEDPVFKGPAVGVQLGIGGYF